MIGCQSITFALFLESLTDFVSEYGQQVVGKLVGCFRCEHLLSVNTVNWVGCSVFWVGAQCNHMLNLSKCGRDRVAPGCVAIKNPVLSSAGGIGLSQKA